jgi:hypothetical protein
MSERLCIGDCGTPVSGRRKRCRSCRRKLQRALDKRRYHELRGQDVGDYEHVERMPEVVVEYARGDPQPGMRPLSVGYRSPSRHDTARRVQEDHARRLAEDEGLEAEQTTWDTIAAGRADDRRVSFPAPMTPADPWARRSSRYDGQAIDNPAAEGMAFSAPNVAGRAAATAHAHDRWGGRVQPAPPIHSAQLHSSVPYVQEREAVQVAEGRRADEHARSLGWTRR